MAQPEEPPVDNAIKTEKEQNEPAPNDTETAVSDQPPSDPPNPSIEEQKPQDNTSIPQEPTQPSKDDKLDDKPTANITDDTKQETNDNQQQPKDDNTDEKSPDNDTNDPDDKTNTKEQNNDEKDAEQPSEPPKEEQPKEEQPSEEPPKEENNDEKDAEQPSREPPKEEPPKEEPPKDEPPKEEPKEDNNDKKDAEQPSEEPPKEEPTDDKTSTKEQNNEEKDAEQPSEEPPKEEPKEEEPTDDTNNKIIPDEAEVKIIEISEEEKNIYIEINNEKESITKCIDHMVESLSKFETDSQQKKLFINDTFDSLITAINNRKTALLNELNNDILTQKSDALKQIESMKQYQQTINNLDTKYKSLTNTQQDNDEKIEHDQRKEQILSIPKQFNTSFSKMEFNADIKLRLDSEALETAINTFGSARIGKTSDPDYDEEKVPSFIDANAELLLAEIPVKKLYRWANESWRSRAQRTIILFYQNKKSYKVRMIVKENESEEFLLNQWVHTNELVEKEALVWIWSAFDATIAKETGAEKKGYTKWCAKFFDDVAFERFQDQYNQARKINLQVLENEEKIRKNKLKQERLRKQAEEEVDNDNDNGVEEAVYYENDEKLCYEMDVWKTYLWGKDASGKGAWKSYGEKSLLQFFENRKKKKIRIVVTENETKQLKLNHWIPTDSSLKSRGDQMWEWQVYDDLATKFLKNSTLKLATICGTFIDKKDTEKFKELFEKYQKISQQAEAL